MARLNDPLTINGLRLRNRMVLPPITTNYATREGMVTGDLLGFYRQRSVEVGLVLVEASAVRADGRHTPFTLGLWDGVHLPGMAELAAAIKAEGAAAVVQLLHGGAKSEPVEEGIPVASPSGVPFRPGVEPSVMSHDQIAEFVESYAVAASRAAAAGFDGVEVHAAHLYLLSQFLSPLTNKRDDRYGGDIVGRATFAVEVVRALRARLGRDYPVMARINAVEVVEGGQTVRDAAAAAQLLEAASVDAIDVSITSLVSWFEVDGRRYLRSRSSLPKDRPKGANLLNTAEIKRAVGVPVIAVGKLNEIDLAARVVGEGMADMVGLGRQMIADPAAAGKFLSGRAHEVVLCKECMSCHTSIGRPGPMKCSTNLNPAGAPRYANGGGI